MKSVFIQCSLAVILTAGLLLSACHNKPKDSDIQQSFNAKAKDNPGLAGITASVHEGAITLTGACPDEACRTNAEQIAKEIKGVSFVINNITAIPAATAPVRIEEDTTLSKALNDIIRKYEGITATVDSGVITLRGSIKRQNLQRLMPELHALHPKRIDNQLSIQ